MKVFCVYMGNDMIAATPYSALARSVERVLMDHPTYRKPPSHDERNPRWRSETWVRVVEIGVDKEAWIVNYVKPEPISYKKISVTPVRSWPSYFSVVITHVLETTLEEVVKNLRARVQ